MSKFAVLIKHTTNTITWDQYRIELHLTEYWNRQVKPTNLKWSIIFEINFDILYYNYYSLVPLISEYLNMCKSMLILIYVVYFCVFVVKYNYLNYIMFAN